MANHILRYPHIVVDLAIVHLEDEAHEVGKDGGRSCLRLYRRYTLASFWSHYWQTWESQYVKTPAIYAVLLMSYGTMCGPDLMVSGEHHWMTNL